MADKERKEQGSPYRYDDPAIMGNQLECQEKLYEYNLTRPTEQGKRLRILKEMPAEIGEGRRIESPPHANWGGRHAHFGRGVYCDSNLTLVDGERVYIGDYCMIAPNVVVATSGHPISPVLRKNYYVYNLPAHIGGNVWLGSGVQTLPGVTIGGNSVIGAGSVVTGDVPANVIAHGAPCRVVREIGEKDKRYFFLRQKA
ncbi:MAG: sugar O-acetyltransferase [Treponema sp.]|nr:sugar O-acetyltransferase [Treponema sp.]